MVVIENKEKWGGKVNFVDSNNVFVGFDTDQSCCEHAGWFIDLEKKSEEQDHTCDLDDLGNYVFDVDFFEKIDGGDHFDGGGMVIFRLVNGNKEAFLHLYNVQNGYYSHGFEMKQDKKEIRSGSV
jgi:hypothetical protein